MVKVFAALAGVLLFFGAGVWYMLSIEPGLGSGEARDQVGYQYAASPASVGGEAAGTAATSTPQAITNTPSNSSGQANQNSMQATLKTNKGDITIEFMRADAPKTVENFTKLAQAGFYNGTKFHRVIAGFMIQGGDPLTKDDAQMARWGTGGPGYQFADEIHANNRNAPGTIAMANAGPNTNGSQFFINTANNDFLDGKHTVFGRVVAGMEAVAAIEQTPTAAGDRPAESVVIESIELK